MYNKLYNFCTLNIISVVVTELKMESPSKCCMFFDLTYIDTFMIKCRQSLKCTLLAFVDFQKKNLQFYFMY